MSRILVIDDSELIVQLLEEFLTTHGFEVGIARDASAGYEMAVSQPPDLILLDVKLPDVSGFELLRTIRNRRELQKIPVIMLTATAHSAAEKVQGFQQGADDYVLKPFHNDELLERIRLQLRKRSESAAGEVREPDTSPSHPSVDALKEDDPVAFSVWLGDILLNPSRVSSVLPMKGSLTLFLCSHLFLIPLSLFFSSANGSVMVNSVLGLLLVWVSMVAALVIASSFFGLSLRTVQAAQLTAVAGLPLVIKLAGASLFSLWTTLSPFIFSAGPMLFAKDLSPAFGRLDIFELWSFVLLWGLLSRYPKSSKSTAAILTAILFGIGVLSTALFLYLGKQG